MLLEAVNWAQYAAAKAHALENITKDPATAEAICEGRGALFHVKSYSQRLGDATVYSLQVEDQAQGGSLEAAAREAVANFQHGSMSALPAGLDARAVAQGVVTVDEDKSFYVWAHKSSVGISFDQIRVPDMRKVFDKAFQDLSAGKASGQIPASLQPGIPWHPRTGWRCNFAHKLHATPWECEQPNLGGHWE